MYKMMSGLLFNIFLHFLYLSMKLVDSHPTIANSLYLGGHYDNPSFKCKFLALKKYLDMEKDWQNITPFPEKDFALSFALSFENLMKRKKSLQRNGYFNDLESGRQTKRSTLKNQLSKRGFSMLTRLKLFSTLGQRRDFYNPYWNQNMISAETRALLRPSGSPLRWG